MAHPRLRTALIVLAFLPAGCDRRRGEQAHGSVTVKLPPARSAVAAPAFSFRASPKAQRAEGPGEQL
jgi:hypothetical protein